MKTKINVLLLIGLGLLVFITACAAFSDKEPIQGHVVEEGTNKPVPGAIVVARWKEGRSLYVDSQTVCVHVESTTTDAQGRYQIPRYKGNVPSHVDSYKLGYERSDTYYKTKAYLEHKDILKSFTRTREERFAYLKRIEYATRCPHAKESEKNMLLFYRALYDEARDLTVTKDDQKIADGFLSNIEVIELGYDAAMKRAIERAEKRRKQQ